MKVYGIIGWKNSGKTSLMERLVAALTARGLTVSTVKHVHHDVDLDQPGKDTFRHRAAGASEVILASAHRFALMHEHRGPEPALAAILARLKPVDLVLVEGYKRDTHPKIEVFRADAGHALIQPTDPFTRAVATDAAIAPLSVPILDLNDTEAIARFIVHEARGTPEPTLAEHLARLAPVDLVLVEGWKSGPHSKIETHRPETGQTLMAPGNPTIRAVASTVAHPGLKVPRFDLDDTARIAAFIRSETGL